METYLKTQIAYFFSNEYRQNFSYLDINNFDSTDPPAFTLIIKTASCRHAGGDFHTAPLINILFCKAH